MSPLLLPALERVLSGAPAAGVLKRLLRAHPEWNAGPRLAAAEAVFGVGLWRRRLAWQAGLVRPAADTAPLLLFCLLRDLAQLPDDDARVLSGLGSPAPASRGVPEDWPTRLSVPDWLAALVSRELGSEAEAFFEALNLPGPVTVRANRLKTDPQTLASLLAGEGTVSQPARFAWNALHLEGRPNIYGSSSHQQGLFEVQDEGSQLLGALLAVQPGQTVLDLCAGAGGKTLLLAAALQNEGRLYAFDPDFERLDRLGRRAALAGVTNLRVLRSLPADLRADRVLVDAPCSSLGALRRGPDVRFQLEPATFDAFPAVQGDLLETAARHLAPKGQILYGTCTLRRAENQDVVDSFLARHGELRRFELIAPWLRKDFFDGPDFRCLPHRHGTDGFFGALLGPAR